MNYSTKILMLACTAAGALIAGTACAQPAADPGQSAETSGDVMLEDVIVTAQKRSERLQDVPVAVTAANAAQVEAAGVTDATELRFVAPSLNSSKTNGSWVTSSIRGVGSFGYGPGVEPPVALYVDGVYFAAPFVEATLLNNIESVEVLKGPQGTLFGRNATGGLVQIKTSTPTSEPSGKFEVGYGNYDTWTANGYIAGGITDTLAADFGIAAKFQGEGYGDNLTTGIDSNRLKQDVVFRSKWVWTPAEETKFTLIGDYFSAYGTHGEPVGFPGMVNGFVPGLVNPDLGFDTNSDQNVRRTSRGGGVSLRIDQGLGDIQLSSITAHRKSRVTLVQDLDFSQFPATYLIPYVQADRQFSQEVQLSSTNNSKFQWTTGVFYFQATGINDPVFLDFVNVDGSQINIGGKQRTKSASIYGQGTYEIFDNTRLTFGGRYTTENRKEYDASVTVAIPAFGVLIPTTIPDRKDKSNKFTYRVSLDHRFSDDVLGYASFNKGFKSGGFNTGAPGVPPFKPESIDAYEVGVKADLLDRRLRLNVAGFYYDYTNIQVQKLVQASLYVINGASARIYGVDADFTAIVSDNFTLTGGVNWISPKFESFPDCPVGAPGGGVPLVTVGTSCDGNQLPLAAKFTGSLTGTYTTDLAGGKLTASGNLYYNSGVFYEPDNVLRQKKYAQLSSTVKWARDNGFSVSVWGKNLTDKRVLSFAASQASGNTSAFWAEPRTYGMTVGYEF